MIADVRDLIIGTRGSRLALWQATTVQDLLPQSTELKIIKTEGDQRQDVALQGGTETGFFTKAIEERLANGEIDIAVHSLKDLPTTIDSRLEVAACLVRAPVEDVLFVQRDWYDDSRVLPLRDGCIVGAGSLRRQALVRYYAPTATPTLIRGNVPTRMRKCVDGEYGAVVLARAGVERLGLDPAPLLSFQLNSDIWLPAPGQGAVAVQVRKGDERAAAAVGVLDHADTHDAVRLERRLLANFEGGCHTAFGAHARKVEQGWEVSIGIDRDGDLGWGQEVFSGSLEECSTLGPELSPRFAPVHVSTREELCLPFQP